MVGLHTLDSSSPTDAYLALEHRILTASGDVLCYSRLPMRQLLRFIPSNRASLWWISEHSSAQSVLPDPEVVLTHIDGRASPSTDLIVLEGVDWFVDRTSPQDTMRMIQSLDALSREHELDIVLPVDSLALTSQFWTRLRALAPAIELSEDESAHETSDAPMAETLDDVSDSGDNDVGTNDSEGTLVHLVNLPAVGFTQAILARRMLQWKRMGFDLAALEPAMAMVNLDDAHRVYRMVESDITAAIDAIRYMNTDRARLTVTEREVYNYRLMSLSSVNETIAELERLISTR
mgnify:FL=1